jgi:threonine/homoserine/homoserine lactone efflux protein
VTGALLALPGATPVAVAAAGVYFVYLAFRIATAPPLAKSGSANRRPSFGGGVFLSLVNPKGYAAMAALFSGFVLVEQHLVLDAGSKALALVAIMILVNIAWLLAGAALTRFFREPRTNRAINVAFALVLLASVGVAMLF